MSESLPHRLVVSYQDAWMLSSQEDEIPLVVNGQDVTYVLDPNPWTPSGTIFVFDGKGEYVVTLKEPRK